MKFRVVLRTAIKAIAANKRRSILTMVGIIIGISSVIAIISIGKGFQKMTTEQVGGSDSGNITTMINFTPNDSTLDLSHMTVYSERDLHLVGQIKGVEKAYIDKSDDESAESSMGSSLDLNIYGENQNVTYELLTDNGPKAITGRALEKEDNLMKHKVVMIGSNLAKKLASSNEKAIGRGLNVHGEVFTIVGVFKTTDDLANSLDTTVFIPKRTYKSYIKEEAPKTTLSLRIKAGEKASRITNQAVDLLKKQGSMKNIGSYSYLDLSSFADGLSSVLGGVTYFISAIAGISLFIAGVGIMNMMYISVSERTKEIGIRRALGAKKRDILLQFLLEGILLTLWGGIIGFVGGIGMAHLIGLFIDIKPVVDLFSILLSIGISVFIGLVFSVMPARSATQKDLIDIMK